MGLFDEGKTAIRVGLNEFARKSVNPTVPYGAEQVAADAVACARAGAAIVHVHSRHDDGTQALDDDSDGAGVYRRAMELTAAECDVLFEPTNIQRTDDPFGVPDTPHVWALLREPPAGARLEVVNLDAWRFGKVGWDRDRGRVTAITSHVPDLEGVYELPEVIRATLEAGLVPAFGLFDLGDARILSAWAQADLVPRPVLIQLNLFCDLMRGPTPSVATLDAFVAELRCHPSDDEVFVFAREMPDLASYEALCDAALERHIHLRVGLGDNSRLFATNAAAVEHAVGLAARHGLTPATPADLRARLGLRVGV
jgi:uncharacterized protein (DUF849 family)